MRFRFRRPPRRSPPPIRFRPAWRQPRLGNRTGYALFWAIAFATAGFGFLVLAPVLDDLRSDLRTMTPDCRIDRVIDGDTVDLRCTGYGTLRARITGYDAPELFSPYCAAEARAAEHAKRVLEGLAARAWRTEVAFLGRDRYGRELVDMRLDGRRVAAAMVEAGQGRRSFGASRSGWC